MTQYDLPEARGLGRPGSEFRATLDHFAEFHHTFHVEIEYPTAFVLTVGDRRLLVTAMQLTDGRLAVELRGYVDDALEPGELIDAGMARLLTV